MAASEIRVIACLPKILKPVPAMLHISREPRVEGLRHYRLVEPTEAVGYSTRQIYFNISADVLFFTVRTVGISVV